MKDRLIKALATGFGFGYAPVAPGTFGSLPGLFLFYLLSDLSRPVLFLIAMAVVAGSVWVAFGAERIYCEKDCQKIVIDEVAGQFVTLLFVPFTWKTALAGFILFRLADVVKVFPANWAQDNLPGGFGVVIDDAIAGLQAGIVLWGLVYFLPALFL